MPYLLVFAMARAPHGSCRSKLERTVSPAISLVSGAMIGSPSRIARSGNCVLLPSAHSLMQITLAVAIASGPVAGLRPGQA
ncbi:hypothetical protein GCM10009573_24350 [Agromyces bracchium]